VFSGSFAGISGDSLVKVGTATLTLSGDNVGIASMTIAGGILDLASPGAYTAGGVFNFAPAPHETLSLENVALPGNHFSGLVHGINWGDSIDLPGLSFNPNGTAHYDPAAHALAVTNGTSTVIFADVEGVTNRFFVLNDHNDGSSVVPAMVDAKVLTHLNGTQNDQVLVALGANETVSGAGGDNTICAGAAGDVLFAAHGDDFVFQTLKASPPNHSDIIDGFQRGHNELIDLYDLRAFVPGNAPLVFIGGQTFAEFHYSHHNVVGMVRYVNGELQVTVDSHERTDFAIKLAPEVHLHADDFFL
jgi:hypothetical protein